jgi:hypothetical protein
MSKKPDRVSGLVQVVMAILVTGVVTPVTGAGNHAANVEPGSPAICVTLKLPQLPQA